MEVFPTWADSRAVLWPERREGEVDDRFGRQAFVSEQSAEEPKGKCAALGGLE